MMKNFVICCCFIFSIITNANAQSCASITALNIIVGEWMQQDVKGTTKETWKKISDKTFEGKGQVFDGAGKIQSVETLRLVEMSGEIFYIAKVDDNEFPTAFKLTECSTSRFVFENSKHDFPKKLTYDFRDQDNLLVSVMGDANNGFKVSFTRIKPIM